MTEKLDMWHPDNLLQEKLGSYRDIGDGIGIQLFVAADRW